MSNPAELAFDDDRKPLRVSGRRLKATLRQGPYLLTPFGREQHVTGRRPNTVYSWYRSRFHKGCSL